MSVLEKNAGGEPSSGPTGFDTAPAELEAEAKPAPNLSHKLTPIARIVAQAGRLAPDKA
jgi:hypothetical protein